MKEDAKHMSNLVDQMAIHKKKTTNRLEHDIISKITWKMFETDVESMGQWIDDPKFCKN